MAIQFRTLALGDLIAGIVSRLAAYPDTSAYRVYNYVPPGTAFPYVTVGLPMAGRSAKFSTRGVPAEDDVITLHVWSDYLGDFECSTMMKNIVCAITSADLTLSANVEILGLFDYGDISVDTTETAKPIRHGILRFRFHTQPNS
jgi:hypothetical protein